MFLNCAALSFEGSCSSKVVSYYLIEVWSSISIEASNCDGRFVFSFENRLVGYGVSYSGVLNLIDLFSKETKSEKI